MQRTAHIGFFRLKVRTRIYFGFAALVVLSLGIAIFGVFQFGGVGTNVGKMDALAGNAQRVLIIARGLEAIRRGETRYRIDADEASLKESHDFATRINGLLTDAAQATLSEERLKVYHGAQDTLRAHVTNLDRFGQLGLTWIAERAKLFTGGDALTAATGKLLTAARASSDAALGNTADAVERTILLVRVANWRFIATLDKAGVNTFKTNAMNAHGASGL